MAPHAINDCRVSLLKERLLDEDDISLTEAFLCRESFSMVDVDTLKKDAPAPRRKRTVNKFSLRENTNCKGLHAARINAMPEAKPERRAC